MKYTLFYYMSGEEYEYEFKAINTYNLFNTCIEYLNNQSGNPDTCFELKDIEGNIIFSNENIK